MKAIVIILAVLLVLARPAAAAAGLGAELLVRAGLGWLIWRRLRGAPLLSWRET
ncbi:MAG: hypothetical protein ACRDNO_24925 [Trebonia sp.]